MNSNFNFSTDAGKRFNDPQKNDPTKQDESDNDPTRIRPQRSDKNHPETPMPPEEDQQSISGDKENEPYKRESPLKKPGEEPAKRSEETKTVSEEKPARPANEPFKKDYNPATHGKSDSDTLERDDEGTPVLEMEEMAA